MLKKKKLFLSTVSLMLTLTFAVVGIYSALNSKTWNVGGRISLSVDEVDGYMVVYEGKFDGAFDYYSTEIQDKAFSEITDPWVLTEEYTTLTLPNPAYFYQVVIQNTDEHDVYVSFEIPTVIVKEALSADDFIVNGSWLSQILALGIYDEYNKANLTSENPLGEDMALNGASKTYLHGITESSLFPIVQAETYDENALNNIGVNGDYTTFSIKLEAGQVFSLYSIYIADFEKYNLENSTEFAVENNFEVNFIKPTGY